MASGQVTLTTDSVDYPCCPWGRGHIRLTNVIGWNVNANGDISFNLISTSTSQSRWYICTSGTPYYVRLKPQVSYDGGANWETLDTKSHLVTEVCGAPGYGTDTVSMSETLINSLGTYHLNGNCQLRFLYYMEPNPYPSDIHPNAFPNSSYSEVSQVPVVVIMEYRPGEHRVSGTWRSHNREGGKCERKVNGSWVEMKTQDGGVGTGNPPSRKANGIWYNQRKVGRE